MRSAQQLDAPVADLPTALGHLGYAQIDPLNICGRMHDLILRNRVAGYREGALMDWLHSSARPGFEHYLPGTTSVLVAYERSAWPMLAPRILGRRLRGGSFRRKLAPNHERLAQRILDEIRDRGPLCSDDIEHDGRSRTGWGTPGRLVKNLLELLHVHGRVLISARRGFRRIYDLPERVLPPEVLHAPEATDEETARFLVHLRLRQRRLVALKRTDLPLVADLVQSLEISGCPPLYCLRTDLPLLERATREARPSTVRSLLLAPLDPLIYDRRLTATLWNFKYTWEAYTPPAKRVRGHYSLPILADTALVGHVDPKADRPAGRLRIDSRSVKRGHRIAAATRELAAWLGLK